MKTMIRCALAVSVTLLTFSAWSAAGARAPKTSFFMEARLDRVSVAIDEEVELRIQVHGAFSDYTPPTMPDFETIGTTRSKKRRLVGAQQTEWWEVAYRLRPTRLGTLSIGPASIALDNKELARSKGLEVRVTNPPPPQSAQEAADLSERLGRAFFLYATSDKASYTVGEDIILTWYLVTPRGLHAHVLSVARAPRLSHADRFESLAVDGTPQSIKLGGKACERTRVAQIVTRAGQPGEFIVDAMRLFVRVEDGFTKARVVARSFVLPIKSLPKGAPDGFSVENVGQFTLTSSVLGAEGGSIDRATALFVDIVVSGTGNVLGLKAPKLVGADGFDARLVGAPGQEVLSTGATGVRGTRRFRYELHARLVGDVPLPQVVLTSFDPKTGRYQRVVQSHGSVKVRSLMGTLYGGQVLGRKGLLGIRIEAGWPGLRATLVWGIAKDLELSPSFQLRWGEHLQAGVVAIEPGVEFRWRLYERSRWSVALYGNPSLVFAFPDDADAEFGVRLGLPGVLASYQASRDLSLWTGLRMPLALMRGTETTLRVPVLVDLGGALRVYEGEDFSVNAHGLLSAGPEFCVGRCAGTEVSLRLTAGASIVW